MRPAVLATSAILLAAVAAGRAADPPAPAPHRVVVAPIHGMIDLGLVPFVERVLEEAAGDPPTVVVLDIDTFGGRVDAAVAIRDLLLRSPVTTVAFVNKRAISAGALIALAAEKIAVARGATIGAATPVQVGGSGETSPVGEKTVSYVRKEFRATADARGRPGEIAEAMVDADVAIEGLVERGKLLTLTGDDALARGVADRQADSVEELVTALGMTGAEIRPAELNWAEEVVRFLTHPVVSSLLLSLALLGLVVELRTPGFGIPGAVGVVCLAAFFWGHALVDLVGWEEVLLVSVGLALLALEIFVIPGFGIVGVLGIVALGAGLTLSMFGTGATLKTIVYAASRVVISAAIAVAAGVVLLRYLPQVPGGRKLVLSSALPSGGSLGASDGGLRGAVGTAVTSLRPAGIAELDGRRVDVVSTGEYVDAGREVEVVEHAGSRVVVKPRGPRPGGAS